MRTSKEQQERDEYLDALAPRIYEILQNEPSSTITQLSEALEAEEDDVTYVLHSYFVEDGVPRHDGPGQGGGWVSDEIREQLIEHPKPEFLGYRWPDSSLHEIPFNYEDPEHRASVGLDPIEAHE